MKLVFFGTPDFAVPTLNYLHESPHDVLGVVTSPDNKSGRGLEVQSSSIKRKAELFNIPIFQPLKLNSDKFISALKETINGSIGDAVSILATNPPKGGHRIEFAPGVECIPVPTNTLPPAIHTNCYILGNPGGEHVVVDPAPHTNEGLEFLKQKIRVAENAGGHIIATIFTHRHLDHIGNLEEISKIYQAPIWASSETLEVIPYSDVNRTLVDGDEFTLSGVNWHVLDTPGHCPGHICLSSEVGMISGDMAVMVGTILVPPNDGDMAQYIASLERIRDLAPPILFPSHGPLSPVPERLLNHYITHRRYRHSRVLDAVNNGINKISLIADYAYEDTPDAHPILKVDQTLSHLHTHEKAGDVKQIQGNWHLADQNEGIK